MPVTRSKKPDFAKQGADVEALQPLSGRQEMVVISNLTWKFLRLQISGPELYVNQIPQSVLDEQDGTVAKPTKLSKPKTWQEDWIYKNHLCYGAFDMRCHEQNLYGFPAIGLKKALVETILCTAKDSKNIYRKRLSKHFWINGPYAGLIPITRAAVTAPDHPDYLKHRLTPFDRRAAARNTAKQMFPVHRPLYQDWHMLLEIRYCPDVTAEADILNAIMNTGELTGFGSNSIGNDGVGGAFRVSVVEQLPSDYSFPQFRCGDVNKVTLLKETHHPTLTLLPTPIPLPAAAVPAPATQAEPTEKPPRRTRKSVTPAT